MKPGSPALIAGLPRSSATYKLSPRSGMLLGYSHFFAGAYYDTPGLPYSGDANFYYVQLSGAPRSKKLEPCIGADSH